MKSLIEVYVHSISPYVDYELASEMSQHGFCDPSMATKASEVFLQFNKFRGRTFSDQDWSILQRLVEANQTDYRIKVYDISHITDRFKALTRGITTTPVIIINGKKHEGAQKSLDALDKHVPENSSAMPQFRPH